VRSNIYNKDIYLVASVGNFYFVIYVLRFNIIPPIYDFVPQDVSTRVLEINLLYAFLVFTKVLHVQPLSSSWLLSKKIHITELPNL
jgi:hypothetical protein